MLKRWGTLFVFTVGLLAAPPAAQAADFVELIVRRDPGLTAAERAELRADAGVDYERSVRLADTEVVSVPAAAAARALRELRADPDVRDVGRNGTASPDAATGGDGEWQNLWALENTGQWLRLYNQNGYYSPGSPDADMDVPEAWRLAPGAGAGVTVGIVDSGAPADHPDLAGQIDTEHGWDYVHGDSSTIDNLGHGTHVTGTVVALNGNGVGISGVAPAAKAVQMQVFADDDGNGASEGTGYWDWVINAFDRAAASGARVVNASLGGYGDSGMANMMAATVNQYPGTLFVVSAGNDNRDLESGAIFLPCMTPAPNVLCVGASDVRDARASFSNYGATAVDVFAPGTAIESTTFDGSYGYKQGTSMAAPNTSGVAALLFAQDSALTGAAVRQRLIDTAETKPGLPSVAAGRVNAAGALGATDEDGDGSLDFEDNCRQIANADQLDADRDGVGDVCDSTPRGPDSDGDGIGQVDDQCPDLPGPAGNHGCPADQDGDGVLDDSDQCPSQAGTEARHGCPAPDSDGDGADDDHDNCPSAGNASQRDDDYDMLGDACDSTPRGPDPDADGVGALDDWCPSAAGSASDHGCPPIPTDRDRDGVPDAKDACPNVYGPASLDGCPAPSPIDRDADGTDDTHDVCPTVPGLPFHKGCPAPPNTGPTLPPGGGQGTGGRVPPEATTPRITSIKATGRAGKVTVSVNVSQPTRVSVTAQRQACRSGRCSWKAPLTATASRAGAATLQLKAGRYRLRVAAGGSVQFKIISVRR